MRFLISCSLFVFAAPALATTTVTVRNLSGTQLRLAVKKPLSGYERELVAIMPPGDVASARKSGGKVLAPHHQADQSEFTISDLDETGAGCRFSVAPVRHTAEMLRVVPRAETIGRRTYDAGTGSTIGDFVFVVR